MRTLYDNIGFGDSLNPASDLGGSAVNGSAVDTLGYNTAVLKVRIAAASGAPTSAATAVKLQECATSNGTFTDALDNTGVAIGGSSTQTTPFAAQIITARIEGLGNLNRKRYLRLTETTTFVGGTTPAVVIAGEIVLGRGYELPAQTAASNT